MGSDKIANKCAEKHLKPISKKRIKSSYLDKYPEWDYLKNITSRNLPLIINGSKCKSMSKEGITMTVQETCAFDSLLQLVISGIATHTYREAIESCNDDIFKLARSILKDGRLHPIHYTERAFILENLSFFRDTVSIYTRDIKRLNTNCNAAHLAEHLFINAPSYVFVKSCTCYEFAYISNLQYKYRYTFPPRFAEYAASNR